MQTFYRTKPPSPIPRRLAALLPHRLVQAISDLGITTAEELRLHAGREATLTVGGENRRLGVMVTASELQALLQSMCAGSLYAYSQDICRGFLTLPGGIRVGICGTAATEGGQIIGVREISGLILRIPNPVSVDISPISPLLCGRHLPRGILIYAPPGVGKTTLLRALAAEASAPGRGGRRCVLVDTRGELCYSMDEPTLLLDILSGYPRRSGIEIAVRSLGAELIFCDEIGSQEESEAILAAANCGVPLIASAHARTLSELLSRPGISALHRAGVFDHYIGLSRRGGYFSYDITAFGEMPP